MNKSADGEAKAGFRDDRFVRVGHLVIIKLDRRDTGITAQIGGFQAVCAA